MSPLTFSRPWRDYVFRLPSGKAESKELILKILFILSKKIKACLFDQTLCFFDVFGILKIPDLTGIAAGKVRAF